MFTYISAALWTDI